MSRKLLMIGAVVSWLLLCASITEAQESGDAPKPALAGDSTPVALQAEVQQDTPDTRPLAGAQNLSLGSVATSHSFLLPSFGVTTQVQTNTYRYRQANSPSLISTTYL